MLSAFFLCWKSFLMFSYLRSVCDFDSVSLICLIAGFPSAAVGVSLWPSSCPSPSLLCWCSSGCWLDTGFSWTVRLSLSLSVMTLSISTHQKGCAANFKCCRVVKLTKSSVKRQKVWTKFSFPGLLGKKELDSMTHTIRSFKQHLFPGSYCSAMHANTGKIHWCQVSC